MTVPQVGVVIVTHNARHHLEPCLAPLAASPLRPRLLVVNSSSSDGTVERARELGAETLVVARRAFNHGVTRELARRHLATPIVVMMTPDAYATEAAMLERLVAPIVGGEASVSYGRQLPREGADAFEAFPREFNYPAESQNRGIGDVGRHGIFTFFCSNSCAAWSNAALDEIGGFEPVLIAEDTFAVSKLLSRGHRIAYVADAVVRHSHAYTWLQEFRLLFDTGLVRATHHDLLARLPDEGHGVKFARGLLARVAREQPWRVPYAMARIAGMYLGYRLGRVGARLPVAMQRRLSSQDYYWDSEFAPGAAQSHAGSR
ncbi:MAG: glycosyltransferase [Vicinamibacteraceae bacterium]|nr:glycosyltransferase [Vicinamibacteraceae bacterium]